MSARHGGCEEVVGGMVRMASQNWWYARLARRWICKVGSSLVSDLDLEERVGGETGNWWLVKMPCRRYRMGKFSLDLALDLEVEIDTNDRMATT